MALDSGAALGLLAFFLLRGRDGSSSSSSSSSTGTGTGLEVPVLRTGEATPTEWFRRRFPLTLAALSEEDLTGELAERVALSLVAQWAHETDRGKAEFNFNLGGWTARPRDNFHTARDRLSNAAGFKWTAYPDLGTAISDQIHRLVQAYPSAWTLLVADPSSSAWIEQLGRLGYYTARPADYSRAWAMQRTELAKVPR